MFNYLKAVPLVALLALAGCATSPPSALELALRTPNRPPPPPPPPPVRVSPTLPSYVREFACPGPEVLFAPGSATVSKDDVARLSAVLPEIEAHCGITIVVGVADPSDQVADREQLAQQRAKAVADILIKAGRDPNLVKVQSWVSPSVSALTDELSNTRSAEVNTNTMP